MALLSADAYFTIGHDHFHAGKPCEDYAIASAHEGAAYAVVSDGCSSGRNTDVGARVVALATAAALREHWISTLRLDGNRAVANDIHTRARSIVAGSATLLSLAEEDLLATCLYAYVTHSGGFVHLLGDGVIALQYRDGHIKAWRYEWEGNMPFYPAYTDASFERFTKAHGGDLDGARMRGSHFAVHDKNAQTEPESSFELTLREGIRGIILAIPSEIFATLKTIAVFSDGVTQIEGTDWKDAVREFLAYKSTTGAFVKRRAMRAIKDMEKRGKGPLDDFACAAITLANNEEQEK